MSRRKSTRVEDPIQPAIERVSVKLTGPAAGLSAALKELDGDPAPSRQLTRVFFDTGDRRLWDRGYALSLDDSGGAAAGRRLVLTRRTALGLRRQVWTAVAPDGAPDPALLPKEAPTGPFNDFRADELLPRFRLAVERAVVVADLPGSRAAARLDIGKISAVGGNAAYRALDVRLEGGEVGQFLRAVGDLGVRHGLAFSLIDPTRIGMALASGEAPALAGSKAGWPDLPPDITTAAAIRLILTTSAGHAFRNLEAATAGEGPGGVHQLRVALRRLRAALSLFKRELGDAGAELNAGARVALKRLGPARDLDVFLLETAPPIQAAVNDARLAPLIERAEAARARAYADVRAMMRDKAFIAFQADLLAAAGTDNLTISRGDAPLAPRAAKLLARRHRKVLAAGDGFAALPTAQRHEARIELKKLRYAAGYFQTLFPGPVTGAYRARMSDLQDELGALNDADVAAALVDSLAGRSHSAALAGAIVKGWQAHTLAANEERMIASWDAFSRAEAFWRA